MLDSSNEIQISEFCSPPLQSASITTHSFEHLQCRSSHADELGLPQELLERNTTSRDSFRIASNSQHQSNFHRTPIKLYYNLDIPSFQNMGPMHRYQGHLNNYHNIDRDHSYPRHYSSEQNSNFQAQMTHIVTLTLACRVTPEIQFLHCHT